MMISNVVTGQLHAVNPLVRRGKGRQSDHMFANHVFMFLSEFLAADVYQALPLRSVYPSLGLLVPNSVNAVRVKTEDR